VSDLVERLRADYIRESDTDVLLTEAADEIDRLGEQALMLAAEISRLRRLLNEAADDIEHWGSYASQYFQDKWHLDDDVKKYRDAALEEKK